MIKFKKLGFKEAETEVAVYDENSSLDDPGFKTAKSFAKRLGISVKTFLLGVQRGKFPAPTDSHRGELIWDNQVVLDYLNRMPSVPPQEPAQDSSSPCAPNSE